MNPPLLAVRGLRVGIGGHAVVDALDVELMPGERLVILGRNGAGKTTLLHTLAGLRPPQAGSIALCGDPYGDMSPTLTAQRRGVVLQHQVDAFPASVLETALIGRHPWLSRWAWESAADARIAREALAAVGLADLAGRDVHTLSGGERQRLAIATVLTQQPRLVMLDEPLSHLDLNHQVAVLDLFSARARDEGLGVVMVMHDINLARRHADRALLLFGDGSALIGPSDRMFEADTLSRLYRYPLRHVVADGADYFLPE